MPRRRLDDLAQRIEPAAVWDNLVLPEPQLRILRAVAESFPKSNELDQSRRIAGRGSRVFDAAEDASVLLL